MRQIRLMLRWMCLGLVTLVPGAVLLGLQEPWCLPVIAAAVGCLVRASVWCGRILDPAHDEARP